MYDWHAAACWLSGNSCQAVGSCTRRLRLPPCMRNRRGAARRPNAHTSSGCVAPAGAVCKEHGSAGRGVGANPAHMLGLIANPMHRRSAVRLRHRLSSLGVAEQEEWLGRRRHTRAPPTLERECGAYDQRRPWRAQ